jgi:predicted nucleic acid-binding protein
MSEHTAFDSDVLIYTAIEGHPLGRPVLEVIHAPDFRGSGSVILFTEVLSKPLREGVDSDQVAKLTAVLGRLELLPLDLVTGRLALAFAVSYRLRAADATHLATAVAAGADRFLTNNRKDFPKSISEIEIVYPEDL